MANEFKHKDPGSELTQVEFVATDGPSFDSQATCDILYASSTTVLTRLGKGADGTVLELASGLPAWTASPTIGSTNWGNAGHAHAAPNSGGTIAITATTGTLAVANGGTGATALTNLITLATHTTGNFVASVADTGAGGILVTGSAGENVAVTIQFNIHGLTTDTIASGDFIAFSDENEANDVSNKLTVDNLMETGLPLVTEDTVAVASDYMVFLDGGATGPANKESIADFVSGIAGTNLTASSGVLSAAAGGASVGLTIALS